MTSGGVDVPTKAPTGSATDNVPTKEASGPVVTGSGAVPITTTPNIPTKHPTKDHTNHGIGHKSTTEIATPTKGLFLIGFPQYKVDCHLTIAS